MSHAPVTFINFFDVDVSNQEKLVAVLEEAIRQ
jgi:hypothetical protein